MKLSLAVRKPRICKCGKNPAEPVHNCPYEDDVKNVEKRCKCCKDCTRECAADI